jgi:hypothetical protein
MSVMASRWPNRWGVRCTAHRTSGQPCRAWAIRGGYVCRTHGGAIGHVRAKANERWELARIERMVARKLGRPLTPAEQAYLAGDMPAYEREVRRQLSQLRSSTQDALERLRATL